MSVYNPVLKLFHQSLIFLKLDDIIIRVFSKTPIGKYLIPSNTLFSKQDSINIIRDNIHWQVNRSDYMQWYIYSNQKEEVWKEIPTLSDTHILDIGSNVGAFSLKLASILKGNAIVHAFDPNPYIETAFMTNLSLNSGLSSKVKFNKMAVGETEEDMEFSFDDMNSGGGGVGKEVGEKLIVKSTTVDVYIESQNIESLSFIKIDVEGFEPFVIKGALKTIERFRPDIHIEITEVWHQKLKRSSKEIFDFLNDLGYDFFLDTDSGFQQVSDPFQLALSQYQINILAKHGK